MKDKLETEKRDFWTHIHNLRAMELHLWDEKKRLHTEKERLSERVGESSAKRLKIREEGWVKERFDEWRSGCSGLFEGFRSEHRRLPTKNGVPVNHAGNPAILLHKLSERWTKDSVDLWEKVNNPSLGVVPVVGVSGCGKTRFLYEVLASPGKWGFYLTATTVGNGGSCDIAKLMELVAGKRHVKDLYLLAVQYMHCLILSRLLILECFLKEFEDLTPLEWLILQTEFGVFLPKVNPKLDPYWSLTVSLVNGLRLEVLQGELRERQLKVLEDELSSRWIKIGELVKGTLTIALDEAQVLAECLPESFESLFSKEKRAIISPFIDALLKPAPGCDGHHVLVSGTGLRFLRIRPALVSLIGKLEVPSAEAVPLTFARFSSWEDVHEVQKFCESYLHLEPEHAADNAQYLLDKFRGRRRCLVSCVEHLMKNADGKWKKEEVDEFYKRLTDWTDHYLTSLYHQVHMVFTSKGLYKMDGLHFDAAGLLRRMFTFIAFFGRPAYSISSKNDMILLECSLGRINRVTGEDTYEYVIEESMVHAALLNYLGHNGCCESRSSSKKEPAKDQEKTEKHPQA